MYVIIGNNCTGCQTNLLLLGQSVSEVRVASAAVCVSKTGLVIENLCFPSEGGDLDNNL